MSPGLLLLLLLGITAAALSADVATRRIRAKALRALASQWRMNYHPGDQLRVLSKVLPRFPIPGAANVRLTDLIYGSDRDRYRYVFSLEFTVGLVGPKRRLVRVASLSEPRERGSSAGAGVAGAGTGGGGIVAGESGSAAATGGGAAAAGVSLNLAPRQGTLLDQYRYLAPPGSVSNSPDERGGAPKA